MLAIIDLALNVLNVVVALSWANDERNNAEVDGESACLVVAWAAGLVVILIILVVGVFALASWLTGSPLAAS